MDLTETFRFLRPRIVAFASMHFVTDASEPIVGFPTVIGTGFIADARGLVVTNRHVAEVLRTQSAHPVTGEAGAVALVFDEVAQVGNSWTQGMTAVQIRAYYELSNFTSSDNEFHADPLPDIAVVQLEACDLPTAEIGNEPGLWEIGRPIATAGYALGREALVIYGKINQISPFLRQGIISSVYPFPLLWPHGFTVDIMSQAGASGSPIFLPDRPLVIGLLYAGFTGTNITLGVPSYFVGGFLTHILKEGQIDFANVPTLASLRKKGKPQQGGWEFDSVPRF